MFREGDLDSTEGHSQLLVGTLSLSDKGLPENPKKKQPPPSPSGAEGPTSTLSKETSDSSHDSTDSDSGLTMKATTKDLMDALTMTLRNINQSPTIPLPVFKGKKGEDPEDHILKIEDYFEIHEIKKEGDKIKRFKDTLFEMVRKWAQTLNYTQVNKFDYNPKDKNDKKASMKYLFLARFVKERRTLEAAYNAWSTLTFDPNKDNIEQFVFKVEDLAKKLGYNEDAQVMAVKSVMPRDVYGICMTYKKLKDLKSF